MARKRTAIKKRLEIRIRKGMQHTEQSRRWLFSAIGDTESLDELFTLLDNAKGNAAAGQVIRALLRESQERVPDPLATEILMWMFTDVISKYCKSVDRFQRVDVRQEGYVALMESARHFKRWTTPDAKLWEVVACMMTARMSVARDVERQQWAIVSRYADCVAVVGASVTLCPKGPPTSQAIVFLPDERLDAVRILAQWAGGLVRLPALNAWVANRVYGETTLEYSTRLAEPKQRARAWARTQQRVVRFARTVRRILHSRPLILVADECLWLSGQGNLETVPIARLRATKRELSRVSGHTAAKSHGDAHG